MDGKLDASYEPQFSDYEPKVKRREEGRREEEGEEEAHMGFLKKAGRLLNEDLVGSVDTKNTAVNFSPRTSYGGGMTASMSMMSMGDLDLSSATDLSVSTNTTTREQKKKFHGPPKSYYDSRMRSSVNLSKSIDLKRSGRNLGRGKRADVSTFNKLYESARSSSSSEDSSSEDGDGEMRKLGIPLY